MLTKLIKLSKLEPVYLLHCLLFLDFCPQNLEAHAATDIALIIVGAASIAAATVGASKTARAYRADKQDTVLAQKQKAPVYFVTRTTMHQRLKNIIHASFLLSMQYSNSISLASLTALLGIIGLRCIAYGI